VATELGHRGPRREGLRPNDVARLVLVDASQEHMLKPLGWLVHPIRAIKGDLEYVELSGVRKNHKLTEAEWREHREDEIGKKRQKQFSVNGQNMVRVSRL
jgi:hypothetical protein